MKTTTFLPVKSSLLFLFIALFGFASCSKKVAFVPQSQELAYVQNLPQTNTQIEQKSLNQSLAENTVAPIEAPKTFSKNNSVEKKSSNKIGKNTIASINKIKSKAPKAINKIAKENLTGVTLLASAAKGDTKAMLDGYLKIGIILLLVGLLVGIVFSYLGYIISVIGVVLIIIGIIGML